MNRATIHRWTLNALTGIEWVGSAIEWVLIRIVDALARVGGVLLRLLHRLPVLPRVVAWWLGQIRDSDPASAPGSAPPVPQVPPVPYAPPAPHAPPAVDRHTSSPTGMAPHVADPRLPGWLRATAYVGVVLAAALMQVMNRVDAALQLMGTGTHSGGSAVSFPFSLAKITDSLSATSASEEVDAMRDAWAGYRVSTIETTLRDPFAIARSVITLDMFFIVAYAVVLTIALMALARVNARMPLQSAFEQQRHRNARMLRWTQRALIALVVVDILEDVQLWAAFAHPAVRHLATLGPIALGPLTSGAKLLLTVSVLLPILAVTLMALTNAKLLWRAVVSARGVLLGVVALGVVMLVGIGAHQIDDVVRAWDGLRAATSVLALVALSVTVTGLVRRMTGVGMEYPAPDVGRTSQTFVLGAGVVLIALGLVLSVLGVGWGVLVPGLLLLGLWAIGLPFGGLVSRQQPTPGGDDGSSALDRAAKESADASDMREQTLDCVAKGDLALAAEYAHKGAAAAERAQQAAEEARGDVYAAALAGSSDDPRLRACAAHARSHAASAANHARVAASALESGDVAGWGDRVARVAGAAVTLMLVIVVARATALDAYIRVGTATDLFWPALVGVVAAAIGWALLAHRPQPPVARISQSWWFWATIASTLGGAVLFQDRFAVTGAEAVGSVGVLFSGFTLVIGVLGILTALTRQGPITRYQLPPGLRVLQLRRFPVGVFLLLWAVLASGLDRGGYHDIRRDAGAESVPAPTITTAWADFLAASGTSQPAGSARPVVLVGAQGGGIRSAVWTSLVMECLFGPGPVDASSSTCAEEPRVPDKSMMQRRLTSAPLPVFLASGASGGSVGLAAWSARRADLLEDGASSATPTVVEDTLAPDFVAPDIARLFLADVPHIFLGFDVADRAAIMERAWEGPFGSPAVPSTSSSARGLTRGMRELYDVTHQDGSWVTPVLALNGFQVEDGCRFLASPVDFVVPAYGSGTVTSADDRPDDAACRGPRTSSGNDSDSGGAAALDVLPSTQELIDYLCPDEDVPLSTAAHLSARFPYVSPSGRVATVERCARTPGLVPGPAVSYDVDGGLFDNSGSGTVVDTWSAIAPLAAQTEAAQRSCLVPIMVQVDNTPPVATTSSTLDARPKEPLAPVSAMLGQIDSRERYSNARAAASFSRPLSAGGRTVTVGGSPVPTLYFRISLYGEPSGQPPLGWTLAPQTVKDMRSQLLAKGNSDTIHAIRDLLKPGTLACTPG